MRENANKIKTNTDRDRGIRNVKDRPDPEIDKIDHGFKTQAIDPVPDRTAQDQAERPSVHVRGAPHGRTVSAIRDEEKKNDKTSLL